MGCMTIGDVWSFPGAADVEAEWDVVVGGVDVVVVAAAAVVVVVVVVGVVDQPGWPALRKS